MFSAGILALPALFVVAAEAYTVVNAKIDLPQSLTDATYPGGLTLDVYAPVSPKTFPVIWFVTGFGADVPVSDYSKLLNKIVARGYIVAGLSHHIPNPPNYIRDGKSLHSIMEWAKTGFAEYMVTKKFAAVPDVLGRSAVMGQSAGNHVVGQALTNGCSVAKAFVMIDPVDGTDPYGIDKSQFLIKPGGQVEFTIPALLLDNGLDPKTVHSLYPPCAPPKMSNDHFYNAWRGPIWNINATAYGHIDCTDSPNGLADFVCPTDPKTDKDLYRAMLAEATTTFLDALFDGKPEQLSVLEDPNHWKVNVTLKHDLKGTNVSKIDPGCVNIKSLPLLVV